MASMVFSIRNETGGPVTVGNTTYANNRWVPITKYIGYSGIKHGIYDIDGPNAGRDLTDGHMIRDRVATKNKWDLTLTNAVEAGVYQGILALLRPTTFHIQTNIPYGTTDTYLVYSNNITAQFLMYGAFSGKEYYTGTAIPIVEV